MLLLIACLIGQFEPFTGVKAPDVDAYLATCATVKAKYIATERFTVAKEASKRVRGSLAKQLKDQRTATLAALDRLEKSPASIVQPPLYVRRLSPGDIGVIAADPQIAGSDAAVGVVDIIDATTMVCRFDKYFVVRGVDTNPLIEGDRIEITSIMFVSGKYRYGGQHLHAMEAWHGEAEFKKRVEELKKKAAAANPNPPKPAPKAAKPKPKTT